MTHYGSYTVGWFQVEREDWLTGQRDTLAKRQFGRDWLRECRDAGPRVPWAWDDKLPNPVRRITELPRTAFDVLIRDLHKAFPRKAHPETWIPLLIEVLQSPLVDDEIKTDLLVCETAQEVWDNLAPAIPFPLHERLRRAFRLEERWTNIDREVDAGLRKMAEVLAEPELTAHWDDVRRQKIEERRQEAERKRLEAERLAREEAALRESLRNARRDPDRGTVELTDEFKQAFHSIAKGVPVLFVTGKPGTGKSTFIRALKNELRHRNVAVCAFTGAAALNVDGQTLHSFFQLPPQILAPGSLSTPNFKLKQKLRALQVLVIDEVSLLRPDMADALHERLSTCRGDRTPFGGVQVVLVGDLYQLPPVGGRDNDDEAKWLAQTYPRGRWFHGARVFDHLKVSKLELTKVFRQTQLDFLSFLGAVREGTLSIAALDAFNARVLTLPPFAAEEFHSMLVPHNKDVKVHNEQRLARLPGTEKVYPCVLQGEELKESETRYPADRELLLKPKAQVVFLKNDTAGRWVNGDFGIVESLEADTVVVTTSKGTHRVERASWDLGKYELDAESNHLDLVKTGTFRQFPIRLSWALTIHKMQGQTVDRMLLDLGTGAFEPGMTYVALSRCRTLEGIRLSRPLVAADLTVDPTVGPWLAGLGPTR